VCAVLFYFQAGIQGVVMARFIISVVLVFVVTAFPAVAKDVKIGTTFITLPAPSGQCELDEGKPDEGRLIKGMQDLNAGRNQILASFADCKELANFRSGKETSLNSYAHYMAPIVGAANDAPVGLITQVCAKQRLNGDQRLAAVMRDYRSRIEDIFEGKINETRFVGVVAEDQTPAVCYTAILSNVTTAAGTQKAQLGITAITVVRGKIIFYHLYAPFVGGDTFATMVAKHKSNVGGLFAANR
jgi:hypothetical protein